MSQSLYTAMGGISGAQTELNVISNNIANLNTTGYKSSSVNFSDVFYTTISSGTGASGTTGGTNPMQVGLGVQVSSVAKNFSSGTWVATGQTTDLMIQGSGFFTAKSAGGEVFYTRAGDFSFDSDGDLVTSGGDKVLGIDKLLSTSSSATAVHIPQLIVADVTPNADFATKDISTLNGCKLTNGTFDLSINNGTATSINIDTTTYNTMATLAGNIQTQIAAVATTATAAAGVAGTAITNANGAITVANTTITNAAADLAASTITQAQYDAIAAAQNTIISTQNAIVSTQTPIQTAQTALAALYNGVTVTCDSTTNGTIKFAVDGTTATSLKFTNSANNQSNFLTQTGLASATIDSTTHTYTSGVLDSKVGVSQVTSVSAATKISSYSIGNDGSIAATYANGDTMSVKVGADGNTYEFVYTTAENVVIKGSNVNVDSNVAVPSNFVVQLASVTNTDGLLAAGSNLFRAGPNSGDIIYSVGNAMGLGGIASGGLEASNVDLSSEFSAMILAQRAVQANSRVFTTTSDIMNSIVSMGR